MTFRHPLLLRLAAKAPHCMGCGKANEGDVVAAHSNQSRDGKSMGMKASDAAVAFMCNTCHHSIDAGRKDQGEAVSFWEVAHRATMRWLVESGHFIVSPVPAPPPVIAAKPKAKIATRKAAWPKREFEKPKDGHKWPKRAFSG